MHTYITYISYLTLPYLNKKHEDITTLFRSVKMIQANLVSQHVLFHLVRKPDVPERSKCDVLKTGIWPEKSRRSGPSEGTHD